MGSRDVTKEETHGAMEKVESPLSEIARVLMRLDYVASFIVHADHSVVQAAEMLRVANRFRD